MLTSNLAPPDFKQRSSRFCKIVFPFALALSWAQAQTEELPESWVEEPRDEVLTREFERSPLAPIVALGEDGHLDYKAYSDAGDRLLDFSQVGYQRSEEPIPDVPVKMTLAPLEGSVDPVGQMKYAVGADSYARIQAALDAVAAMSADADGFRGAVLLKRGTYYLSAPLIVRSGVVLRGEGDGDAGTSLIFTTSSSGDSAIQLGAGEEGAHSEELIQMAGALSKEDGVTGDEIYQLRLPSGYAFRLKNPAFKPEIKLEPFVGEDVLLTMKAVVTTREAGAFSRLKHNMPYEVKRIGPDDTVPLLDPNLTLPAPVFGSAAVPESKIADSYVPSGSLDLNLEDASEFKVGDAVVVYKTTNMAWIDELGLGQRLRHIRGGREGAHKRPWPPQTYDHPRTITAIEGNTITLDIVLPQSIAEEHGGGFVRLADKNDQDSMCGVESLRIIANYDTTVKDRGKNSDFRNLRNGIDIAARHAWVRDCTVKHVWFAAVNMGGQFCTVRDTKGLEPVGPKRGGRRYAFNMGGAAMGNLVYKCYAEDGRHDFVVGARVMGPNAFVRSTAVRGGQSEPHHRWGCGTLYDRITMKDGGSLAAINRGDSGSGHGWAGANTVFWNCAADAIVVFDPETKGENNFAIGYTGPERESYAVGAVRYANTRSGYWRTPREGVYYGYALMGNGYIESPDQPVEPASLFEQQLIDRIGAERANAVLE